MIKAFVLFVVKNIFRTFLRTLAHSQLTQAFLKRLGHMPAVTLLEGLYLVRSLPPWTRNAGKRLVKSPKVYWRDSGMLHTLAGLETLEKLLGRQRRPLPSRRFRVRVPSA